MAPGTVVVKKYGNRRLYDTDSSRYITLDDLARMIREGRDIRVVDAKTSADLTKAVLLQIITEQEKDQDLLPVAFLKKVIAQGDSAMRESLQRYLTVSLDMFLNAQKDWEQRYRTLAGNLINPMMWMMNPFTGAAQAPQAPFAPPRPPAPDMPAGPDAAPPPAAAARPPDEPPPDEPPAGEEPEGEAPGTEDEIQALKKQMAQMQAMLARLAR